jgi:hypothetical protein
VKLIKILVGLVIALIFVAAVVAVVVLQNINAIVKMAVEEVGSDVTKTAVVLNAADIKLTDGRGTLNGLSIANPAGFSRADLFTLGEAVVDIDPASLTKDVVVIDEIKLSGVNLLAEHKGVAETNIKALIDNLGAGSGGSQSQPASDSGEEVLLAVKKVVFSDNSLSLVSESVGNYDLNIPSFEVNNLGSETNGLTPTQLAKAALKPLLDRAQDTIEEKLEDELKDKAKDKLKEAIEDKLSDEQKEKVESLKSLFKKD